MSDIPDVPTSACRQKESDFRDRGMRIIGGVFIVPDTGQRATIDYWGRVQWWDVDGAGRMHAQAARIAELEYENEQLRQDARRLDWLADRDNPIGNVQLPTQCVTENLGSMRDAIDAAMDLSDQAV
ncbi:hypothetical protein [Salinisphaera sp. T31B1]|uniref:hypothetical protein n=1 Tax=Salinisphaera sp. T31B1 TaxID=727963 RepID=UPI0033424024